MAGISITLAGNFSKLDELEAKAKKTSQKVKQSFSELKQSMADAGRAETFASIGSGALGATAGVAALVGVTRLAQSVLGNYAAYDGMVRGLKTLEGTAEATTARIELLRKVAQVPGLGFEEAVQADIRLRAVGISAEDSEAALRAFGNALATVGGGKDDLDGVILGLSQIAAKGKISAEEINQIAERVPQVRAAMQAAFGTADTEALQKSGTGAVEFIQKLTAELGKLPKVSGGARNDLDNMGDSFDTLKTKASEFGAEISGSWIRDVTRAFNQAGKDLDWFKGMLGVKTPGLAGPAGQTEEQRQSEAKSTAEAEAGRESRNAEIRAHNANVEFWAGKDAERAAALKEQANTEAEIAAQRDKSRAAAMEEYNVDSAILSARLRGDAAKLAALEREKKVREEMAKLTQAGFTADEARKPSEAKVDAEAKIEAKKKEHEENDKIRKTLEGKIEDNQGKQDSLHFESTVGAISSMQRIGGGGGAVGSGLDYQRQAADLQREGNELTRQLIELNRRDTEV